MIKNTESTFTQTQRKKWIMFIYYIPLTHTHTHTQNYKLTTKHRLKHSISSS